MMTFTPTSKSTSTSARTSKSASKSTSTSTRQKGSEGNRISRDRTTNIPTPTTPTPTITSSTTIITNTATATTATNDTTTVFLLCFSNRYIGYCFGLVLIVMKLITAIKFQSFMFSDENHFVMERIKMINGNVTEIMSTIQTETARTAPPPTAAPPFLSYTSSSSSSIRTNHNHNTINATNISTNDADGSDANDAAFREHDHLDNSKKKKTEEKQSEPQFFTANPSHVFPNITTPDNNDNNSNNNNLSFIKTNDRIVNDNITTIFQHGYHNDEQQKYHQQQQYWKNKEELSSTSPLTASMEMISKNRTYDQSINHYHQQPLKIIFGIRMTDPLHYLVMENAYKDNNNHNTSPFTIDLKQFTTNVAAAATKMPTGKKTTRQQQQQSEGTLFVRDMSALYRQIIISQYHQSSTTATTTNDNNNNYYNKHTSEYHYYIQCASTAYLDLNKVVEFLQHHVGINNNSNTIATTNRSQPLMFVFSNRHSHLDALFRLSRCQIWNTAATRVLFQGMIETQQCQQQHQLYNNESLKPSQRIDYEDVFEQCAAELGIEIRELPVPETEDHRVLCSVAPSPINNDSVVQSSSPSWLLYPRAFEYEYADGLLVKWLSIVNPNIFHHRHNCSCHTGEINELLRVFGRRRWSSSKSSRIYLAPSCRGRFHGRTPPPPLLTNKISTNTIPNTNIPTIVMTLNVTATYERIQQYMPKQAFDAHSMQGIRLTPGITGYRMSMEKALRMGLTLPSSIMAIFDDDFRIRSSFDRDWEELTAPGRNLMDSVCYYDTLLNDGVVMLGTTVWNAQYYDFIFQEKSRYLYDGGKCFDASILTKGSFGVIFSRKAAELAIAWLDHTPPNRPFDWFFGDLVALGYPVRALVNPIVIADVSKVSTVNENRDPSRHTKYEVTHRHKQHNWGNTTEFFP